MPGDAGKDAEHHGQFDVVEARQDVFDYIEMFYNPKRKHARNGMLSPVEFERQQAMRQEGV